MIVVRVELHSAVNSQITELARMQICNDGTHPNPRNGNYFCRTLRGRSKAQFDNSPAVTRSGGVHDHPRLSEHVWNLVAKCLYSMRYGQKP
jgi:hypothetical protein